MVEQESCTIVFSFLRFFFLSFNDLFHLASIVVDQKVSTEEDVMSKIKIDDILKYAPDKTWCS